MPNWATLLPYIPGRLPFGADLELLPEQPLPPEEIDYTILPSGDVQVKHVLDAAWSPVTVTNIVTENIAGEVEHDYFGRRGVDENWILPMPDRETTKAVRYTIPTAQVDAAITRPVHLYRSRVRVRANVSGVISEDTSDWSDNSYWRLRIPRPPIPRGD